MEYSDKVRVFLARHGMEPELVDPGETTAAFLVDMELGLAGRTSSLKMIPTYLTPDGALPFDTPAAVIDAGGTNFRTARVTFTPAGPVIDRLSLHAMPGAEAPVAWEDFIALTAARLAPLLDEAVAVGFCFSYPTEETPERDGRILNLTKQVRITGYEGRYLCRDLQARLRETGAPERPFVLLNDTPAVLLSGAASAGAKNGGMVGLISGTGTNTCCVLPDAAIKKAHGAFSGNMLVNLESGAFEDLPRGDYDAALDRATVDPGIYRHEKMTSGAYVGELCRLTLRGAAEDGLFTPAVADRILALDALPTPQADAAAAGNALFPGEAEDLAAASQLCRAIFDRAARCVCANLSAILTMTDSGSTPERPALLCVDGSLYRRSQAFRPLLHGYMRSFTEEVLGRHTAFFTADNATMLGTAAAALLNMPKTTEESD